MGEYGYDLPDERIAKHPLEQRDRCKLLVRKSDGEFVDTIFKELPAYLPEGAMLVYNNTRVINARLRFRRATGALIEVFCLEPCDPRDYEQAFASTRGCSWLCFVGNSKKWKADETLSQEVEVADKTITLSALRVQQSDAGSVVRFDWDDAGVTFSQIIEAAGEIPIPPYLNRRSEQSDRIDYQTVYSHIEGSVAAPTAGLHFTPEVLEAIDNRGVARREVTLHVGAGTFQPVKSENIGGHTMHSELIVVDRSLISELAEADGPVIAVGTTSVRTLESLYQLGCMVAAGEGIAEVPQWWAYSEDHPRLSRREALTALAEELERQGSDRLMTSTRIIIAPGYEFKVVDGMVTNFHQPNSTLLLLVSAFTAGHWREMYDHALEEGYRFLSYGDAQLLL